LAAYFHVAWEDANQRIGGGMVVCIGPLFPGGYRNE
jgi:hypothetical protein